MKKYLLAAALALAAILPARAQVAAPNVAVTWLPIGKMASGISVTTSPSAAAALPAGGDSLYIFNTGAQDAFVAIGGASVAASTTAGGSTLVKAGTCANINRRNQGNVVQNYISAITATSTTTLAVESGVGSASCSGGAGGGGGGGGGAVTMASGAVASGAYSSGAFASGAFASGSIGSGAVASGAFAAGALAAGAGVDGWDLTQGAKADSVCPTDTGTCSIAALIKRTNQQVTAGQITAGTAGSASTQVLTVQGIASMTPLAANITQVLGSAISATNGLFSNCLLGNAACATGTGAVGSTSQRVAVGTDTATVAGSTPAVAGFAAVGAAPPTGSQQMGAVGSGATGGLMAGLKTCDLHATYDASDNGSKEMIAAVSGRTIYICGFIVATGGTATNLKLVDGTGTDCATGTPTNLTPAYQLLANDKIGMQSAFWTGLKASGTNRAVCVNASAGNAHQAEVWYTIQ